MTTNVPLEKEGNTKTLEMKVSKAKWYEEIAFLMEI